MILHEYTACREPGQTEDRDTTVSSLFSLLNDYSQLLVGILLGNENESERWHEFTGTACREPGQTDARDAS
jgi:hypothetical protein